MADTAVCCFPSGVMEESKDVMKKNISITESAKYKEKIYGKCHSKIIGKYINACAISL